ncbi:MAG: hypothetical protein K2N63_05435, partial [Lachnospiraceae bacterium]|nr:hypothetical protein [Lachnospiraceae bacterium]
MKQRMKKTGRMDPGEMEDMEGGERVTHEWMEPEYQSKERIKAFDREWMEMDVDRYFASKIVYIIMNIMGCFMMFFPVGFDINAGVICVITWMLLGTAVISRIQPYVYGMGRGEDVISVLAY